MLIIELIDFCMTWQFAFEETGTLYHVIVRPFPSSVIARMMMVSPLFLLLASLVIRGGASSVHIRSVCPFPNFIF